MSDIYERRYGSRYDEPAKYARAADIAKLIRRDIKAAIAAGDLPGRASDYRVRSDRFSGGQSIDIRALRPELYQVCKGIVPGSEDGYSARGCRHPYCKHGEGRDHPHATEHLILSVEGQRVERVLKDIHGAYNHDGSDVMTDYFDVRYYGGVDIQRPDERGVA